MKYLRILIIVTIFASFAYIQSASAVQRAPFDSSALQPMPVPNVSPNVSENVNSNPLTNKKIEVENVPSNQDTQSSNQDNPVPVKNNSPYFLIWVIISILIIMLGTLSFVSLRPKK